MFVLTLENNVSELLKDSPYEVVPHTVGKGNQMTKRKVICYLPENLAQASNMPFYGEILLEEWHTQPSGDWCPRDNIRLRQTGNSIPTTQPIKMKFLREGDEYEIPYSPLRQTPITKEE